MSKICYPQPIDLFRQLTTNCLNITSKCINVFEQNIGENQNCEVKYSCWVDKCWEMFGIKFTWNRPIEESLVHLHSSTK